MLLQLRPGGQSADLLDFEWSKPLARWNDPRLVRMARGASRHIVRFVETGGRVYALKEIGDRVAHREYSMLREMLAAELPVVEPVGTVTERESDGRRLEGVVVTRYLDFALPYSYLLAREGSVERQHRLIDAAAVLLVRLHLEGFYWGDCSLANILFRRDAGGLSAYLVDTETAEHHPVLSDGQRQTDIAVAMDNFVGGMEDLIAAGRVEPYTDSEAFASRLEHRYLALWGELTKEEEIRADEPWRVEDRVRRLNELGFNAEELSLVSVEGGNKLRIRPSVVEEGHHHRRLLRLTGLDVQENQARRLLHDLGTYRMELREKGKPVSEAVAAYRWLTDRFEPFVDAIPADLATRLEPAEAYHEFLEHRWFLSEEAGQRVADAVAVKSFIDNVLRTRPQERVVLPDPTGELEICGPGTGGTRYQDPTPPDGHTPPGPHGEVAAGNPAGTPGPSDAAAGDRKPGEREPGEREPDELEPDELEPDELWAEEGWDPALDQPSDYDEPDDTLF